MKRNKIIAAIAALTMLAVGTGAFAEEKTDTSAVTQEKSRVHQELTDEQKAEMLENMKTKLSEKLEAEEITQDEYDTAITDLENGKMPKMGRDSKGAKAELTDEQKAEILDNMKTKLSEKLEAGEITQDEYDTAITDLENGKMPKMGRGSKGAKAELTDEQKAEMLENMKTKLSEKLEAGEITQDEYDTAITDLEEGKMPKMGRGSKGAKAELTDEQKAEMLENMKTKLSEKLEAGEITQEEYDTAITDLENGKMPKLGIYQSGNNEMPNMQKRQNRGMKKGMPQRQDMNNSGESEMQDSAQNSQPEENQQMKAFDKNASVGRQLFENLFMQR